MTFEGHDLPQSLGDNVKTHGIMPKNLWHLHLKQEVKSALETGNQLSVIIFDVDNLKGTNDTFGHIEGDQVIENLEQAIDVVRNSFRTKEDLAKERAPDLLTQSTSRRGDLLAASIEGKYVVIKPGRIGGDEFAALCHTDENGAEVIAKRIKSLFQEALSDELKGIGVDISVGFSSLSPGMTASSFLKKADEMLYRDKESHIPNLNDEQQMIIRGIAVALREMKVQPRHIPKYLALYAAKELGNNPVA